MKTRTPGQASYADFRKQKGGSTMNVHRGIMYPRRRMAGGGFGQIIAGIARAAARKAPAAIAKAAKSKIGQQLKKVVQEKVAEKAVELVTSNSGLGGTKKKKKVCVKQRVGGQHKQKGGSGFAKSTKARAVYSKK